MLLLENNPPINDDEVRDGRRCLTSSFVERDDEWKSKRYSQSIVYNRLTTAAPQELVRCRVERQRISMHRVYLCLLEESYQLLLVARKSLTPSFSVDFFSSFNDQSDRTILARLSHVGGCEYALQANSSFCLPKERPQLATIIRRDNDIHHKSRRVCVIVPALTSTGYAINLTGSLLKLAKAGVHDVQVLQSKIPIWNADRKVYELSFSGRISDIASRKNFQLEHPDPFCSKPVLQFGRLSKSVFALDYSFPLNLLQAFAASVVASEVF
ncbi:hypothetical protein Pelo_7099 [Pelomyxa schiedti]|nr:hypothetical protein Pelo_7099 [Pelomyxa schiedti]